MEIDFDAADRVSDFVTVPAGTYLCRVAEVRPGQTRAGDERWSLRLVIAEGPHVGKQAAWDSLVFSSRGRGRARTVLAALGMPARGKVQIEPRELEGRVAFVQVRPAEYSNPNGDLVRRNEVPYDGYQSAGDAGGDRGGASHVAEGPPETPPDTSTDATTDGARDAGARRGRSRPSRTQPPDPDEVPF